MNDMSNSLYLLDHSSHTAWEVCSVTDHGLTIEDFLDREHLEQKLLKIDSIRHIASEIARECWHFARSANFNVELSTFPEVPYDYRLVWGWWKYGEDISEWDKKSVLRKRTT